MLLLLLLNKTLNKFAKKVQKRSLFWGLLLMIFFIIFDKIFSPKFFSCYTQVLMNPNFMQSIRKRNNFF